MATMADASPPLSVAALTAALREACAPVVHLCYADCTDGHAIAGAEDGRALRADGRDIQALVVSSCFEGQDSLARQQLVNRVLSPHILSGRLHSVQMRCWTPAQWEKLGRPDNLGKPCFELPAEALGSPTLSPLSGLVGEPLVLQSCTEAPSPAAAPPQAATRPPASQPPVPQPPLDQTPLPSHDPLPPPSSAPPPAPDARPAARPEVTVEMLVAHLQSQGVAGLASARSILGCDRANALQRRAAALVVAAGVEAVVPPPAPRSEPVCSVQGCAN